MDIYCTFSMLSALMGGENGNKCCKDGWERCQRLILISYNIYMRSKCEGFLRGASDSVTSPKRFFLARHLVQEAKAACWSPIARTEIPALALPSCVISPSCHLHKNNNCTLFQRKGELTGGKVAGKSHWWWDWVGH